jgi:hypothetical protein
MNANFCTVALSTVSRQHEAEPNALAPNPEIPNDLQPPSKCLQVFLLAPLWCIRSQEPKIDNDDDRLR